MDELKDSPVKISAGQLALRFGLEVASLVGLGAGARQLASGSSLKWEAALGAPLLAGLLWITFAVRGDPSRSGNAPVPVPGGVRLALELAVFGGGAAGLALCGWWVAFGLFAVAVVVHHLGTTERLAWLMRQQ